MVAVDDQGLAALGRRGDRDAGRDFITLQDIDGYRNRTDLDVFDDEVTQEITDLHDHGQLIGQKVVDHGIQDDGDDLLEFVHEGIGQEHPQGIVHHPFPGRVGRIPHGQGDLLPVGDEVLVKDLEGADIVDGLGIEGQLVGELTRRRVEGDDLVVGLQQRRLLVTGDDAAVNGHLLGARRQHRPVDRIDELDGAGGVAGAHAEAQEAGGKDECDQPGEDISDNPLRAHRTSSMYMI